MPRVMPNAAAISSVIASWVSVPQVSRSPKCLSHNKSSSPITANRCPAERFSARAAARSSCIVESNMYSIVAKGSDKSLRPGQSMRRELSICPLFADRDGLPRALPNRVENLLFVVRRDFFLQQGQRVVILESKHLRDDAHAHPVA